MDYMMDLEKYRKMVSSMAHMLTIILIQRNPQYKWDVLPSMEIESASRADFRIRVRYGDKLLYTYAFVESFGDVEKLIQRITARAAGLEEPQ